MEKRKFTIVTAILICIAMGTLIYAQGRYLVPVKGGRLGLPDLTEEQQEKIQSLNLDLQKELIPIRSQLELKNVELKALLIVDNPDEKAINSKIDEIGKLETEIQKATVKNNLAIRALLTPEQRIIFDGGSHGNLGMMRNQIGLMGPGMGGNDMRMFRGRR